MINKLCRLILFKWLGWRIEGQVPEDKKYIFAGIGHTSNWDFIYGWMVIKALDLEVTIFAKDVFFFWPASVVCRWLGVAPVNRRESTNFVDGVAKQLRAAEEMIVLIAPEGTRSLNKKLKSGYYYIAKQAEIPIVAAGPDYKNKVVKIMQARAPMESFEKDAAQLEEFCKVLSGYYPEKTFKS